MDTLFLIVLSAFAVYGIICAAYNIILYRIPAIDKYLTVRLKSSAEETEVITRMLLKKYPDCEIIIINDGLSEESADIIENLQLKYSQIHFAEK